MTKQRNIDPAALRYSTEVEPRRIDEVRALATAAGNFSPAEIAIAAELVEERLARGLASGYEFVFLDDAAGTLLGYTCYGLIDGTDGRYDLYWIVVDPRRQGLGLGVELLRRTEQAIRERGGHKVYVETSSRDDYLRTRRFYELSGYLLEARLEGFYADGDAKCIFVRAV
ncbi:MAG: GNAT family N-acetyltransferase [Gammaproteobacteria bacterium]|nr:GNAT family N-acetyltransferase [Gammaproteobacteria bacterium]